MFYALTNPNYRFFQMQPNECFRTKEKAGMISLCTKPYRLSIDYYTFLEIHHLRNYQEIYILPLFHQSQGKQKTHRNL